jgi:hypothetical protein
MVNQGNIAPPPEEEPEDSSADVTAPPNINLPAPAMPPVPSRANSNTSKFDPKRYRQVQSYRADESAGWMRKHQTIIPVRKPNKKQFVRSHPSAEYRADAMPTIADETTGDVYLLDADLNLPADIENKIDLLNLVTSITTDGSVFLWCYKNSTNSWSDSARIAIRAASQKWVRVIADRSSNGYILEYPVVAPPDPVWPPMAFAEILETAFGSRYIDSLQHPLVRKLRGDFNV